MASEGMVHALEIIHTLLARDGCLIDLHPDGQPPPFVAWIGGQSYLFGRLQESDDFIEYAQADAALAEAIRRGWFEVERQASFSFITHGDSAAELFAFLNENWTDAVIADEVGERAQELSLLYGPISSVQMSEQTRIARLRKISRV